MTPHVSCVMATRNRPAFLRQALRCFLRQRYTNSELIVVDDSEEPMEDLCRGLLRVRYLRLAGRRNLGEKLNLAIEEARGDLIQKLDDDDFYHEDFLATAVARSSSAHIVAWDCFLVLIAGEQRLRFSGHGWSAGGTLCFARSLWKQVPFRDLPRAVDYHFIADSGRRAFRVCAPELYMLVRHGTNTWTSIHGEPVDDRFRRMAPYKKPLRSIVEPLDWPHYEHLCASAM